MGDKKAKKCGVVLQIGAGGVGGVVAHKMAQNRGTFKHIILASRTKAKCRAIAESIRQKGLGEITIDKVDADDVKALVKLIKKHRPSLVVNVALPYQDLAIMEACLRTKTHYLDTANYEHPDSAHFEYKEQWAYDARFKEAGIFGLLGSGFDPGVTNIFCAYAKKHYFDEIHTIDILDCNAGDHGYAFATNFNPEINLREVSSKGRYWVKDSCDGACGESSDSAALGSLQRMSNTPHSPSLQNAEDSSTSLDSQRGGKDSRQDLRTDSPKDSHASAAATFPATLEANLALNPDLKKDSIYRRFEREERHWEGEVRSKRKREAEALQNQNYCGGEWRDVAPLALMKEWDYPEVGVKNSYLLYHEELESLVRNIKGLRRIRFFMTFGESYLTHMKCLENVGFLRIDEVAHKGGKIIPIEVLKTLLPDPASLAPRTKGKTNIGCYITGLKDGRERTIYIYNVCEHEKCFAEVGAQGVSYTTGVPAMIGAKLICEKIWGVGKAHSSCGDFLGSASDASLQRMSNTPHSLTSHNPRNSSAILECAEAKNRLKLNLDMPKGGEAQGLDTHRGAGVWNMEQNDPDFFMEELDKQGLPWAALERDKDGKWRKIKGQKSQNK